MFSNIENYIVACVIILILIQILYYFFNQEKSSSRSRCQASLIIVPLWFQVHMILFLKFVKSCLVVMYWLRIYTRCLSTRIRWRNCVQLLSLRHFWKSKTIGAALPVDWMSFKVSSCIKTSSSSCVPNCPFPSKVFDTCLLPLELQTTVYNVVHFM